MTRPAPALSGAQAGLLDLLFDRVETQVRAMQTPRISQAVVMTVTAGAASDLNALCVISWQGTDLAAPYLASYTPTVGHVVAVLAAGSQVLILGRVLGTP
jgi:hypothetical protein